MSERKRILFVDDERNVLNGLRRMLNSMKDQWKMEFVTKATDALSVMENTQYDVIVSDLRMPGMDGLELLENVREKYPQTIRFMLSGYTDQPLQNKAARCVHQFISKPCDAEQLKKHVSRAFALYDRLRSEEVATVLAEMRSLPVLPQVYQEVVDLLNKPSCSLRQIGQAIARDIGMSSKILQVVNSAFYGQGSKIVDPVHAVSYLGQKATEALILTSGVFSELPDKLISEFSVTGLQDHCIRVGSLAKEICKSEDLSDEDQETASMAGILHDAGKMILISKFTDRLREAIEISKQKGQTVHDAERELILVTHAELGGCLLDLWGLPNAIIEAVTFHHEPSLSIGDEFSLISAIHIADAIDHEFCCELGGGRPKMIDMAYLQRLGIEDKLDSWRKMHLPVLEEEYEHVG